MKIPIRVVKSHQTTPIAKYVVHLIVCLHLCIKPLTRFSYSQIGFNLISVNLYIMHRIANVLKCQTMMVAMKRKRNQWKQKGESTPPCHAYIQV